MKMMHPTREPDLNEGLIIQHAFMHEDDEVGEQSAEWCKGTMEKVSNGSNLQTPFYTRPKNCRKGGAAEVR